MAETVTLAPDELAALFDAPVQLGYELAPNGIVLPAAFVAARRALTAGRPELALNEVATLLGLTAETITKRRKGAEWECWKGVRNKRRVVLVTFAEVVRQQRATGRCPPVVRETAEQASARGLRAQAALARKLGAG